MIALLGWRFWFALSLVAGLTLSHAVAYRAGKANVRAEWTAAKLADSEAARQKEKGKTIANAKVDHDFQAEKTRRIAAERNLDNGLRDFTAAIPPPSNDTAATTRDHGTGGLVNQLLSECASHLVGLAKEADRLEGKVVALQAYIAEVVQK